MTGVQTCALPICIIHLEPYTPSNLTFSVEVTYNNISSIKEFSIITNTTSYNGFSGGNGTSDYPYQISSEEQFLKINDYMSSNFVLTDNLDFSELTFNNRCVIGNSE